MPENAFKLLELVFTSPPTLGLLLTFLLALYLTPHAILIFAVRELRGALKEISERLETLSDKVAELFAHKEGP